MKDLTQVKETLLGALGSEALFSLVKTRVILKTGVDLGQIKAEQNSDPETLSKVLTTLSAMGYSPAALEAVAKRNQRG